jgi:hypothetical protein
LAEAGEDRSTGGVCGVVESEATRPPGKPKRQDGGYFKSIHRHPNALPDDSL